MDSSPDSAPVVLATQALSLRIAERSLVDSLTLHVRAGECIGILGQNGCGKTTLLHTLMRFRAPHSGSIEIAGKALNDWSRKSLARQLGILFQKSHDLMPATVMETVLTGRFPHLRDWEWEGAADWQMAKAALDAVGLSALAEREIGSLSGGERHRLAIATLLTQSPRLFLLDEPGNHLDSGFALRSLKLLREHALRHDAAICMATHDINLAARLCDQIVLMMGEGECLVGKTREILTPTTLSIAFGCAMSAVMLDEGRLLFYPT